MNKLIGIDIGGTKCAVSYGMGSLKPGYEKIMVLDKTTFPTTEENGPREIIDKICREAILLLSKYGVTIKEISRAGISCGGPIDGENGIIKSPPNLPGWDDIPVVKMVESLLGVHANLKNDADACALAEWKFGAGRGCKNIIFLTFGTGLGAGLILNGQLYTGACNMAGEIGHIRMETFGPVGYGKAGALEGFCSGEGIAQLARAKAMEKLQMGEKVSFCDCYASLQSITAKIIAEYACAGDTLAREIYRISGEYLGRGLSILIDLLNPEKIIIGSIFSRSRELLWPAALNVLMRECISLSLNACSIVPAELGEKVGDYAALAAALYEEQG